MKRKFRKSAHKEKYAELLDDLCSDFCKKKCFFKDALIEIHPSPRLLVQLKCIYRFKKILAKEREIKVEDISSSDAVLEWIERGYAERFGDNYDEEKTFMQIYKETIRD